MKKILFLSAFVVLVLSISAQKPSKREIKSLRKTIGVSENFVYIPQGERFIDHKNVHFDSFWMMNSEVSNEMYNCYLHVDTTSKYQSYPVVNISYDNAILYCQWLNTQLKDKSWEYRLPTREEWVYAACADQNCSYSNGTPFLKNIKGITMFCYKQVGDEAICENEKGEMVVKEFGMKMNNFPIPVLSLYPNDWGLFNMCGNAAEMVMEKGVAVGGSWNNTGYDIRIESTQTYSTPSPMIGFRPVLVKKKL